MEHRVTRGQLQPEAMPCSYGVALPGRVVLCCVPPPARGGAKLSERYRWILDVRAARLKGSGGSRVASPLCKARPSRGRSALARSRRAAWAESSPPRGLWGQGPATVLQQEGPCRPRWQCHPCRRAWGFGADSSVAVLPRRGNAADGVTPGAPQPSEENGVFTWTPADCQQSWLPAETKFGLEMFPSVMA